MDIFDRNPIQRVLITTIVWGMGTAGSTFVALLLWTATQVPPEAATATVRLGYLELMRIERISLTPDTYRLSFIWLSGLVWYGLIWCGLVLAYQLIQLHPTKTAPETWSG